MNFISIEHHLHLMCARYVRMCVYMHVIESHLMEFIVLICIWSLSAFEREEEMYLCIQFVQSIRKHYDFLYNYQFVWQCVCVCRICMNLICEKIEEKKNCVKNQVKERKKERKWGRLFWCKQVSLFFVDFSFFLFSFSIPFIIVSISYEMESHNGKSVSCYNTHLYTRIHTKRHKIGFREKAYDLNAHVKTEKCDHRCVLHTLLIALASIRLPIVFWLFS